MAARLLNPEPSSLPLQHGMLRASGVTIAGARSSDVFEILVDSHGELALVLLDVQSSGPEPKPDANGALAVVRRGVLSRAPIYDVVADLRAWTAAERETRVGISLLRFCQPEARVEILNAGMPSVACVLPGGHVALHHALSLPLGEEYGEVHPYELAPLVWGSSWLMPSDGLTASSLDSGATHGVALPPELLSNAATLASYAPEALSLFVAQWMRSAHSTATDDATLLVVNADPTRRFRSGIRP